MCAVVVVAAAARTTARATAITNLDTERVEAVDEYAFGAPAYQARTPRKAATTVKAELQDRLSEYAGLVGVDECTPIMDSVSS